MESDCSVENLCSTADLFNPEPTATAAAVAVGSGLNEPAAFPEVFAKAESDHFRS
jgi:hypothetical protein